MSKIPLSLMSSLSYGSLAVTSSSDDSVPVRLQCVLLGCTDWAAMSPAPVRPATVITSLEIAAVLWDSLEQTAATVRVRERLHYDLKLSLCYHACMKTQKVVYQLGKYIRF